MYNLEGGEGICIIDKIGKSALEEDVESEKEDDVEETAVKKIHVKHEAHKVSSRPQKKIAKPHK